jgi:signal recognition particle subunit SEC65
MPKNLEINKNLYIFAVRNILLNHLKPNKMNVYNLKNIENCYVCGNIDRNLDRFINSITSNLSHFKKKEHKKEAERQARLKAREDVAMMGLGGRMMPHSGRKLKASFSGMNFNSYDNTVVIVSGNCGIGMKSKKYYEDTFAELDKILAANNCYIFFVRGNNDDPSYFDGKVIDFEHVKTLPDYSVVALKNYNCLCIGGSVSIDKEWKLSQEEQFGKKMYWENEAPIFDEKKLEDILNEFRISCVITSTAPTFVYPGTNSFKRSKWFSNDKAILKEFNKERKTMDKIYEKLMDCEHKPYLWFYGRFKLQQNNKTNDIMFMSLTQYQTMQVNNLLMSFFNIDPSKELGSNDQASEGIFEEDKKHSGSLRNMNYHAIFDEPAINEGANGAPHAPDFLDEEIEPEGDEEIDELADFDGEEAPQEQQIRRAVDNHWAEYLNNTAAVTTAEMTNRLREELDSITQVRLDHNPEWLTATLRATDARR